MKVSRRINSALWRIGSRAWAALDGRLVSYLTYDNYDGIALRAWSDLGDRHEDIATVMQALDLIAEVEPRRLSRMRRDVDAIMIADLRRVRGGHPPGSRVCYISIDTLRELSIANVALVLAHEATHARLDRLRVVKWWAPFWHRIEHRCLREELSLAGRLPRDRFPTIDAWIADRAATSGYGRKSRRRRLARHLRAT